MSEYNRPKCFLPNSDGVSLSMGRLIKGKDGLSSYEQAVKSGIFTGTEEEFNNLYKQWIESSQTALDAAKKADAAAERLSLIVEKDSFLEFPPIGEKGKLYIDKAKNKIYRWDEKMNRYVIVGSDYQDIQIISGGDPYGID